jgi:curved DNA-binding protein CbpA
MDHYEVLGISRNSSQEDIKKAYRKETMKWHPDRNNDSAESKSRFYQITDAYKVLSEVDSRARYDNFDASSTSWGYEKYADSDSDATGAGADDSQSKHGRDENQSKGGRDDSFEGEAYREVMLDFAIKLAQYGMPIQEISSSLQQRGCLLRVADSIADSAFKINAQYSSTRRNRGDASSGIKQQKEELQKAFVGVPSVIWSPENTVDYYLPIFRGFAQKSGTASRLSVNLNSRLLRILAFSLLFFIIFIISLNNIPGNSELKIISDQALLMLPIAILTLMFLWTLYRKLWLITAIAIGAFIGALTITALLLPQALNNDTGALVTIALSCYTPFLFITLFANYFYYLKANKTIRRANEKFASHQEKIVWINNRAGTSLIAVLVFLSVLALFYLSPQSEWLVDHFESAGLTDLEPDLSVEKLKSREDEAGHFFKIAESHFNKNPPDYLKAKMAYTVSAEKGSLLAAYQLGYMYYNGVGIAQNDIQAFDYFELATRSPLAYQPHNLELATGYLAEAYNNLGVMYQSGYGTQQDQNKAMNMYRIGAKFGSMNAKINMGAKILTTSSLPRTAIAEMNRK